MEPTNISAMSNEQLIGAFNEAYSANSNDAQVSAYARELLGRFQSQTLLENEHRELLNRVRHFGPLFCSNTDQLFQLNFLTTSLIEERSAVTLNINFSQIENNPGLILDQLRETFFVTHPDASDIYVVFFDENGKRQEGVDQGSLSRDFIGFFFKALISNQKALLFEKIGQSESFIPILKNTVPTQEEMRGFSVMGRLMGICLCNPVKEMRIPPLFDLSVFQAIFSVDSDETFSDESVYLKMYKSMDPEHQEVCDLLSLKSFNAPQKERALELAFLGEIPEEYHSMSAEDQFKLINGAIWENYKILKKTIPLALMATGFRDSLSAAGIEHGSALSVYNLIQGIKISENKVVRHYPETLDSSKRKQFLEQWIKTATQEELQRFVLACTGSVSAPVDGAIEIQVLSTDKNVFVFSACFGQIKIPEFIETVDYETFKLAIGAVIEGSGYNKA